jgi:hypothetical protein
MPLFGAGVRWRCKVGDGLPSRPEGARQRRVPASVGRFARGGPARILAVRVVTSARRSVAGADLFGGRPLGHRVLHRGLRSLRSEWVTAGAPVGTPLEAGSRPLARSARPERAGRHVEWAAGSSDWRLRSYSAVAPEDREGAGRRSSDRRPELVPGRPQGRAPRHRGNGEEGEPNQYGSTGFGRLRSPGEPQERSRSARRRDGRTCSVCEAFEEDL